MDVKIGFDKTTPPSELVQVPLYNSLNGQPLTDAQGTVLVTDAEQFLETSLRSDTATSVSVVDQAQSVQSWNSAIQSWSYVSSNQTFVITSVKSPPLFSVGSVIPITGITPSNLDASYVLTDLNVTLKQLTIKIPSTLTYGTQTAQISQIQHADGVITVTLVSAIAEDQPLNSELQVSLDNCWPDSLNNTWTAILVSTTQLRVLVTNQRDATSAPSAGVIQAEYVVNTSVKVVEQFPELSAVSTTLLGIPREEQQLGLFADVASYGLDRDQWETYFASNDTEEPAEWRNRLNRFYGAHFSSTLTEYTDQSALALEVYPPAYGFPFNETYAPDGLYRPLLFPLFLKFMDLGNKLYDYFAVNLACAEGDTACELEKRDFLNLFINKLVVRMTSMESSFSTFELGQNVTTTQAFAAIDTWTDTWRLMRNENTAPVIPGTTQKLTNAWVDQFILGNESYKFIDTEPGYDLLNRRFVAALQSKKSFRYQPGRISGFTFGVKADTELGSSNVVAEWGCINNTDQYVFRLQGGVISIVRRSLVPLTAQAMALSGITNQSLKRSSNFFDTQTYWTSEISQDAWTGDKLNGTGDAQTNASGYLLDVTKVTMMKIEFGWYGAIGARFYAYVPVGNGDARWVVLTTIVIENTLGKPCLVDPYFKFSYLLTVDDPSVITKPQFVYKYGSSYYIDGGDSGTLRPVGVASLPKSIPPQSSAGLITLTPKTNFVSTSALSGENPIVQNKKISLLSELNSHSSELVRVEIRKCVGCPEFAHTYLPHVTSEICGYTNGDPDVDGELVQVTVSLDRTKITKANNEPWLPSDVGAKLVAPGLWNMYLKDTTGNLQGYFWDNSGAGTRLLDRKVPVEVFYDNQIIPLTFPLNVRVNRFLAVAVSPQVLTGNLMEIRFLNSGPREAGVGRGHLADFALGVTNWKPQQYESDLTVDHYEKPLWVILKSVSQIEQDGVPVQQDQDLIQPDCELIYHAVTNNLSPLTSGSTYYVHSVFTISNIKYFRLKATLNGDQIDLDVNSNGSHLFEITVRKNQLTVLDTWNLDWHCQLTLREPKSGLERGEGVPGVDLLRMDYRLPRPDGVNTGACSKVIIRRLDPQIVSQMVYTTQMGTNTGFYVYKDGVDWVDGLGLQANGILTGSLNVIQGSVITPVRSQFVESGSQQLNINGVIVTRYWARLNYDPTWIADAPEGIDLTQPFDMILSVVQVQEPPTAANLPRRVFRRLEQDINQTYHVVTHLRDQSRVNNVELYQQNLNTSESLNPAWWLQKGYGAQATAQISGGQVTQIQLTPGAAGKNYLKPPQITIQGGGGTNAQAWSEINSSGQLVQITVSNPGSGYVTAPIVVIQDTGIQTQLTNGAATNTSNLIGQPPSYLSTGNLNSLLVDVNNSLPSRATQTIDTYYVGANQLVQHDVSQVFAIDKQVITPGIWNNEAYFVSVSNLDTQNTAQIQTSVNIVEE